MFIYKIIKDDGNMMFRVDFVNICYNGYIFKYM